jgi:hypothetical protein
MLVGLLAMSHLWNYSEPQNKTWCMFRYTIEDYWERKLNLMAPSHFDIGHHEN